MSGAFRVGFVTGATPDKWARIWRERYPRRALELLSILEADQESGIRDGALDMALVRLPIERGGLHAIPLYAERAVAVAGREHLIAAADEVELDDLVDDQLVRPHASGWRPTVEQLEWPPMSEAEAIETVAAGTGVVMLPASIARLHHRKDTVARPVRDLDPTTVALAWRIDHEDERVQLFIGIVRGRTSRSTRT